MTVSLSSVVDVQGRQVKKITVREYQEWLYAYWANVRIARVRHQQYLRLGQAFLNKFYPTVIMPSLFYERDTTACARVIWQEFIDPDSHIKEEEESQ
jgi:hypothetical protein